MASDASALTTFDEVTDLGTTLGAWNAMIRRAQLTDEQKLMCLLVASYADNQGEDIHCGVVTLAVDSGRGYSTARRYLGWMRKVGLIELVKEGNRRKGLSDVYRLIVSPNLSQFVPVMDPDESQVAKDEMRAQNRLASSTRTHKAKHRVDEPLPLTVDLRSPNESAEATDSPVDGAVYNHVDNPDLRSPWTSAGTAVVGTPSALTVVSAENGHLRSHSGSSALTQGEPPPPLYTSPKEHTSPTTTNEDLRTNAAGSNAESEDQDEFSDLRSLDEPTPPATPARYTGRASVRPGNVIPLRPRTA